MEGSKKNVFREQNKGTNTYPIHVIKNTAEKQILKTDRRSVKN